MNPIFSKITKHCTIHLVRHAESLHNSTGLVAGRIESPLTETGITQAHSTAQYFKDASIQAVFASTLSRAQHTAAIIAKEQALTPIIDQVFIEISAGILEGKSIPRLREDDPNLYQNFKRYSWECVPEAERIDQLTLRATQAWARLIDYISTHDLQEILLVSHGGFLQWLFRLSLGPAGTHTREWAPIITFSNCGISTIKIEPVVKNEVALNHFAIWNRINYISYGGEQA